MTHRLKSRRGGICGATALCLILCTQAAHAQALNAGPIAPSTDTAAADNATSDIVVTAQKRSENINSVGMSIQAATGRDLIRLGVTNTADLTKIVSGFNYTLTQYGTPVFTIRGVGFQDTSLAASPTVSVYRDEIPIPFAIETAGAALDVERVEVLKGPQGTLFGANATGGAVNYIANKPTDHPAEGFDASIGRFGRIDLQGYISGPLSETTPVSRHAC